MSDEDMKVTERLAYAHLLMEHFYAIDEAIFSFILRRGETDVKARSSWCRIV